MPLHGKIVVIKRSGGDGTEFPLTASCLFGRKPDCDIRIQLPQVSKEHCRIELNENKEVILTNLSSVNPTRVNGEVLQQSERLKHGDVITVIDRSFRFEYPPAPTPKKRRSSTAGKAETLQVLQDQQVRDTATVETGEKRISEASTDVYLKDGTNNDNIQRSLEKTIEVESKEDGSLLQSKTSSPFNELYQMIKQTLNVKTPRKPSDSQPASRFCTPKPGSVRKTAGRPAVSTEVKSTPKKVEAEASSGTIAIEDNSEVLNKSMGTPKLVKKQRKSFQVPTSEMSGLVTEENESTEQAAKSATPTQETPRNKRLSLMSRTPTTIEATSSPQRLTVSDVVEQISAEKPRTPTRRRSKEATPVKPAVTKGPEEQAKVTGAQPSVATTEPLRRTSPRSVEKKLKAQDVATAKNEVQETAKKRKSGELGADLPTPQLKRKRVSFGGQLDPELFDKRLPPDSPLRKGATPRRSLCLIKPKHSLLRRASAIGLIKEFEHDHELASPKVQSPAKRRTPSPKKSPKAKTPSPKTPSPGKKSPKAKTPSPKTLSPGKKSPKAKTPSPKTPSPGKKSPKAKTPSPKTPSPGKKSPKAKTPSPKTLSPGKKSSKAKTPSLKTLSPGKKSPKAKTPSPKTLSPGKKSPKAKTLSPKTPSRDKSHTPKAERSPKTQRKSTTPAQPQSVHKKTPTGKRRSSPVVSSPPSQENTTTVLGVTPAKPENQTPTVQGRFSVSRISTPSPTSEQDVAAVPVPFVAVTPKLPLRRKSMKSTTRKTPGVVKSAVEVMRRRSGISRASMKVMNSWADIVKFGQNKAQVVAPAKNTFTTKKTRKVVVSKPKTPARRLKDHVSTGHADSPVTIVVGKAHKQKLVQPTGAAPRLVHNTAVLKKSLKMDEDLTGLAEIFKTPVNARQRKSVINEQSATKTPLGPPTTSLIEASVLSTPEEPGEMIVSPLSDASAVKHGRYNSEAVHRLLHSDEESTVVSEIPALEITIDDPSEQQCTDSKLTVATPKQKPEKPDCLTGIKRIMKTPRQKAEPVEDLRGKLLKTPKAPKVADVFLDGVKELLETPQNKRESVEDLSEVMAMETQKAKDSPLVCATDIKRKMKTPKEKNAPVEDMVGLKRLMQTPKNKGEPAEENFGLKGLMKSPRLKGNAAVEDFEGLQELMEEPLSNLSAQMETKEGQDQTLPDCGSDMAKEPEVTSEEQLEDVPCAHSEDGPSDIVETVPQADIAKEPEVTSEEHLEDVPCAHSEDGPSDIVEAVPQADIAKEPEADEVVCDDQAEEMPCSQGAPSDAMETVPQAAVDQNLPEEQPKVETATCEVTEMDTASIAPDTQKNSARGRRAKVVEPQAVDDEQEVTEHLEDTVVPAPVKGRRVKKTESAPLPTVRQAARSRKAKSNESRDVELTEEVSDSVAPKEKVAPKPKRGRNAKQTSIDQAEIVPEVAVEAVNDQTLPINVNHEAGDPASSVEEAVLKPKRGRKNNQASVEQPTLSENTQPEEPIPTVTIEKPRRGRKPKQDSVVVENTGNAVETKQQSQAPVRSKRGRNAKPEEEKVEGDCEITPVETAEFQEPCEKSKRTRKAKQEPVELKEIQMAEIPVTEKVEAPVVASKGRRARMAKQESVEVPVESASSATLADTVEMHEQAAVVAAEKPRRGGRRTKQDAKSVIPIASTEVQDKPSVNPTEKPKRGRRVKQDLVIEEVEITGEVPEEKAEQKQVKEENMDDADSASALAGDQPDAPVIKPTRGRGVKSVKNEVSQAIPAKRARRGTAPPLQEAAVTEAAVVVSKSGSRGRAGKLSKVEDADNPTEASVEPAKRGRKAAAKPVKDNATATPSTEKMVEEKCVTAELPPVEVTKGRVSRKGKAVSAAHIVQAHATEDVNNAVVDDTQMSKKSVNSKTNLAVTYEIMTPTPVVKAARGRKAKLVDQDEAPHGTPTKRGRCSKESTEPSTPETTTSKPDNKRTSRKANKAEEEDLSDKALPSEPVKRARRGAKVTDAVSEAITQGAEEMESAHKVPDRRRVNASKKGVVVDSVQAVEAETQPRTRRGRAAKK